MNQQGRMPGLRYLRKPHSCNYCYGVSGFTHDAFGESQRRLFRVDCQCGKKHYACFKCAGRIGSVFVAGRRQIRMCAKRYYWKHVRPQLKKGGKGA